MEELLGRVAIITGGGTGIGQGVAILLATLGCKILICGRRMAALEKTVQLIQKEDGQADKTAQEIAGQPGRIQ